MKTAVRIFLFTVLVTAFYDYVGQMVPQKVTYPPEEIEIGTGLTTMEMVEVGKEVVGGKGTCLTCHTIGSLDAGRFPDLANIGLNAASRVPGKSDLEYLAESLYEPNAYIVDGFLPGMPVIHKPPISLSEEEILTVIAYLQSLGGTPSVTLDTKLSYTEKTTTETEEIDYSSLSPLEKEGRAIFSNNLCHTCHSIDSPQKLIGPSLYDIGARQSAAQIKASIMEPDAIIAEGYQAGLMGTNLQATGFYERITVEEIQTLVDFLASMKGN
jgi:mono/diheme cytochrome c family protein